VHGTDGIHSTSVTANNFATNTWYYLAVAIDTTAHTASFYSNGTLLGTTSLLDTFTGISAGNAPMLLGNSQTTNVAGGWQGLLDEIRVESVARSSNWISACWLNQSASGSTFTPAPDTDMDGMPDDWEIANGLIPWIPPTRCWTAMVTANRTSPNITRERPRLTRLMFSKSLPPRRRE